MGARPKAAKKTSAEELREAVQSGQLSDADIETKIAEMKAARTARDFKASDAIRAELADSRHPRRNHKRRHPLAKEIDVRRCLSSM